MTQGKNYLRDTLSKVKLSFSHRVPVILQSEMSECGLAVIAMISSFYGRQMAMREIRQQYTVARDGMSLFQVIKICEEIGLACRPLQLDLDQMKELRTPAILFWNKMHFVVLESVTSKGIHIVDPGVGRRYYTWEDALPLFSNIALEVIPGLKFQRKSEKEYADSMGFYTILSNNIWLLRYLIPLLILSIIVQLSSIAAPKLLSLTIDEVVAKNDEDFLYLLMYIFGGLFFFKVAASWIHASLNLRLRVAITQDLSTGVIAWLLRLPTAFFDRRAPADILRRTQAIDNAHIQFTAGWLDIGIDGFFAIVFVILMALINTKLAGLTLFLCFMFFIFRLLMLPVIAKEHNDSIDAETKRNTTLFNAIQSVETMKLYGYESAKLADWANHQAATEKARASVQLRQAMNGIIHTSISHTHTLMISALGAIAIMKGENSVGDLFAFVLYKDMFMGNVLMVLDRYMNLKLVKVELSRAEDIINEPQELVEAQHYKSSLITSRDIIQSIEISSGLFRYSSFDRPILENAQFLANNTETVAIYGTSGSGKSTLLKILAGFYHLESGRLKVNGIPMRNFGLKNYRQRVAYVTANDEIIDANVIDNITMNDDHFNGPHLQACVEQAGLLDSILMLANGFNTLIGQTGVHLSSGQKQRLLIARALYRKPDVLLFDEPTSHLDSEARDIIIETIRSLSMLCIVVTHDPVMVAACDKVYRMSQYYENSLFLCQKKA